MSDTLEQIKKQIDIVDVVSEYIDLSKKGRNFWALCPFHEDSNPSMSVSPEKQLFKCFVCGAGGDAIKFVSDYEKISFPEALAKLGEKVGIKVDVRKPQGPQHTEKELKMVAVMKDAMEYFQYSLMTDEGVTALEYAEKRNLNAKIREDFLIGYAPQKGLQNFLQKKGYDLSLLINSGLVNQAGGDFFRDRLIFGLTNSFGQVVAFSARDLSGKSSAKYINSPESKLFSKSNTLYNYSAAKEVIKKEKCVFINEGFMDVIAMNRAGFRNSVAIMGTALTKEHIGYLIGKDVILMLDSDKAGVNATVKSVKVLLEAGITTKIVKNKEGKDPDEVINSVGVEGLREIALKQIDALEFIFELHQKQFTEKTPTSIHKFTKSFVKYLSNVDDMTKDFYVNKLSNELGLSREIILKELPARHHTKLKITPQYQTQEIRIKKVETQRNYSYSLILSMIKKPMLIQQYIDKQHEVIFKDPILLAISNYLVSVSKGNKEKPSKELRVKVNEIIQYGKYVNSTEEFNELIERINKEAAKSTEHSFDVKLRNTNDISESAKILEEMIKNKGSER